jgi:hypothetical protein
VWTVWANECSSTVQKRDPDAQSIPREEAVGMLDQRLEQDSVCELAEMSGSVVLHVVTTGLARQHWSAVTVLPVEVVGRLQRQDGLAWDL